MVRSVAYGEGRELSFVESFGVRLSASRMRHEIGDFSGKDVGDFGCGFEASFVRSILPEIDSATIVDVALAGDLQQMEKVHAVEGPLPDSLKLIDDESLDIVLCNSVLEHLWDPDQALAEFHRVLKPGGVCFINVPSWMGKHLLELTAFRFGISTEEMDDHKRYYDPKDLWPMLVRAGFRPRNIRCKRHKFGLNVFACCRVEGGRGPG